MGWDTLLALGLMCQLAYLVTAGFLAHHSRTSVSSLIGPFLAWQCWGLGCFFCLETSRSTTTAWQKRRTFTLIFSNYVQNQLGLYTSGEVSFDYATILILKKEGFCLNGSSTFCYSLFCVRQHSKNVIKLSLQMILYMFQLHVSSIFAALPFPLTWSPTGQWRKTW